VPRFNNDQGDAEANGMSRTVDLTKIRAADAASAARPEPHVSCPLWTSSTGSPASFRTTRTPTTHWTMTIRLQLLLARLDATWTS
jgi:hypothetical protein